PPYPPPYPPERRANKPRRSTITPMTARATQRNVPVPPPQARPPGRPAAGGAEEVRLVPEPGLVPPPPGGGGYADPEPELDPPPLAADREAPRFFSICRRTKSTASISPSSYCFARNWV